MAKTKTPTEYMNSKRTPNQQHFTEWVLAETGIGFKTKPEADAFDLGVKAAGLYSRYQRAKREATRKPAETPTPAGRPTRSRKAA